MYHYGHRLCANYLKDLSFYSYKLFMVITHIFPREYLFLCDFPHYHHDHNILLILFAFQDKDIIKLIVRYLVLEDIYLY